MYNSIQKQWIKTAKELDSMKGEGTVEDKLTLLIEQERDVFIKLVFDTKETTITKHSFDIKGVDDPDWELHGKLVRLAGALCDLPVTSKITGKLIEELDNSLHSCFAV